MFKRLDNVVLPQLHLKNGTVDLMSINPSKQSSAMINARSSLSRATKSQIRSDQVLQDEIIKQEAMDGVKELFRADFDLFGYDDYYNL